MTFFWMGLLAVLCGMMGMYYHNCQLNRGVETLMFSLALAMVLAFAWLLKTNLFHWQLFASAALTVAFFASGLLFHNFRISKHFFGIVVQLDIPFFGLAAGSLLFFVWLLFRWLPDKT